MQAHFVPIIDLGTYATVAGKLLACLGKISERDALTKGACTND